jgi:hypothetical protein
MANIDGIIGYNSPGGTNKLLAAFGNDIIDVSTGLGYGLNLTVGNKVQFETFIDLVFATNGVDKMRTLVGGTSWSDSFSLPKQIIPKYLKKSVNNAQMLIGNCILTPGSGTALNYKSYVFRSSVPRLGKSPAGAVISQSIQWAIESGRCNIKQDTKKVKAVFDGNGKLPYFKTRGIRVGDPFFLLGGDIGQYTVASVDSEYELTLNETIPSADAVNTNIDFWVGSAFFPVGTDDNDEIKGFGENNSRDLIFKLFSLWYYTGTQLKQVKGAPGTSAQRSVINDRKGNTYYFHGSSPEKTGIYRYNGVESVKISRAIDPFIFGMNASNFAEVVAWEEGDELRFFIGDLSNNNEDISMTKAVATLNTANNSWDVTPITDTIKCATNYISSNVQNAYCGNDEGQVLKMNTGYNYNGDPIALVVETGVRYPSGSEILNDYPYIQAIGRNVRGIRLSYKLWDAPVDIDDSWTPLGELAGDKTEFPASKINKLLDRAGSGIAFRIEEDGVLENNWLFEKISVFYKPDMTRLL